MKKMEWVWIAAAAGLALLWWRKQCESCQRSPHAAGKTGNQVPGYWADVL